MKLPLRLDAELLIVYDARGEVIFYRDRGLTDRFNAACARELRFIVAATNFAANCNVDGMESLGPLSVMDALRISREPGRPVTPFEPAVAGPRGIVR